MARSRSRKPSSNRKASSAAGDAKSLVDGQNGAAGGAVDPEIQSALAVDGYSLHQVVFLLWYGLTTTLSPDKIAELYNRFYTDEEIDRWSVLDVTNTLEQRYEAQGSSWGSFRLQRPEKWGACPCDLGMPDCAEVKRTVKTRANDRYLSMAAALWDRSARELVRCPREPEKGLAIAAAAAVRDRSNLNSTTAPYLRRALDFLRDPSASSLLDWLILDILSSCAIQQEDPYHQQQKQQQQQQPLHPMHWVPTWLGLLVAFSMLRICVWKPRPIGDPTYPEGAWGLVLESVFVVSRWAAARSLVPVVCKGSGLSRNGISSSLLSGPWRGRH